MDSRFPTQPEKIEVPLYPLKYLWAKSLSFNSYDFGLWAASHYNVERSQIVLANRGSEALLRFLQWLSLQQSNPLYVAIPAFCCREVLQAILSSGAIPFFIDISEQGAILQESIDKAHQAGCKVVIIPQFFGDRAYNFKKQGMILIDDEAQSFPSRHNSNAEISLFSCGMSKKLAGIGGGGICFHNTALARDFGNEKHLYDSPQLTFLPQIVSLLTRKIIEINRPLAHRFNLIPHLEFDLKVLLEKWSMSRSKMTYLPMSGYQQKIALHMVQKYRKHQKEHIERIVKLKEIVHATFGETSLSLLRDLDEPTIFAIRVPSRFQIAATLASKGIQTTWYYYPLNRLSSFSHYPSEDTPITDKIASEVLILPFQWKHTTKQFKKLCGALCGENLSAF